MYRNDGKCKQKCEFSFRKHSSGLGITLPRFHNSATWWLRRGGRASVVDDFLPCSVVRLTPPPAPRPLPSWCSVNTVFQRNVGLPDLHCSSLGSAWPRCAPSLPSSHTSCPPLEPLLPLRYAHTFLSAFHPRFSSSLVLATPPAQHLPTIVQCLGQSHFKAFTYSHCLCH